MRNQGTILGVAISLLVISAVFIYVVYAYIPNKEAKLKASYDSLYTPKGVFMVTAEDGLDEGTLITDELFNDGSIDIVSMPENFIPHALINPTLPDTDANRKYLVIHTNSDPSKGNKDAFRQQVIGKVLAVRMEQGMLISDKSLGEEEKVSVDHTLREMQLEVENEGGELLKAGKYVDIIVKYKNGAYDIVMPKKYVDKIILPAANPDGTPAAANGNKINIQISLDEIEYRDLEFARRLGSISIRVYAENNQYASLKTFDYEGYRKLINTIIQEDELKGEHKEYFTEASLLIDPKSKITLDTEHYIKLQEYADLYLNKIEKYIDGKTILDSSTLDDYLIEKSIKAQIENKLEKESAGNTVNTSELTKKQLREYEFTDIERAQIISRIVEFSNEEKIEVLGEAAKDIIKGYTNAQLLTKATERKITKVKAALETKAANLTEEDKKNKALEGIDNDTAIQLAYVTDQSNLATVKSRILSTYSPEKITLTELSYIAGCEKVDTVIGLIMGNKYITSADGLNRSQIYNKYAANYKSSLGTRRLVADKIVDQTLLFYQTNGPKIDSVAYLVKHNLYDEYTK